jgi:hypothetical protein
MSQKRGLTPHLNVIPHNLFHRLREEFGATLGVAGVHFRERRLNTPSKPAIRELAADSDPQGADATPGDAPLPHERDERSVPPKEDAQHRHNRQPIAQAHRDVEAGLQDTERIGTPTDVPSSADNRG